MSNAQPNPNDQIPKKTNDLEIGIWGLVGHCLPTGRQGIWSLGF